MFAGDFSDPVVALWNRETFQLVSRVGVSGPLHDVSFSPSAANQLACVGSHGVYFCSVHTCGSDLELRVNSIRTTLCFLVVAVCFSFRTFSNAAGI